MEKRDLVGERILVDGNAAAALGCVYGGATVCAWYPITPSSSVAEAFQKYCAKLRVDTDTGEQRYAIVQAEDEIASIGMVTGAGWNGARAFTATSGPGVSLMTEFIGLAYFAEIPVTIINVQRGGPSTGMPTRTQQADILSCAYASHGDTKHVLLFPQDPHECFEHAAAALDLADRLQTPVFVMTDLDIGMNQRLCEPFDWDDARRFDRGKVMSAEELEAGRDFGRYKDVDGDGIPWRTLPGTHPTKGSYFTRGTTRDEYARYSETGPDYLRNVQRLNAKFGTAATLVPQPVPRAAARKTRFGVIYFGSTSPAMDEALHSLAEADIHLDALRLRAFPFPASVLEFIEAHDEVFVVEQNRDAQMRSLLINELAVAPFAAVRRAALRRHADHRALHHPGHHAPHGSAAERDLPQVEEHMTYIAKPQAAPPDAGHTTRSATRGATTKARSARCAPAAATTASAQPSSRPAGSWTSSRTAWPSCRASAAAARRPTTSSAPATASTPCTGACPAC